MRRYVRWGAVAVAAALLAAGGAVYPVLAAGGPNLATGKTATTSSANAPYVASNLNDGNAGTYWESANNAFPQWAQIDLGAATSIDQVVLKLPGGWEQRSETITLQGSSDGGSFTTIVGSTGYVFNPASANTVTLSFAATATRYVRANITANTVWPAAQLSELEIYGSTASTANLALGRSMTASGTSAPYTPNNANDSNASSYWESTNNAFPQWLQVDLGSSVSVSRVVLKVPPASDWGTRTQTLVVQGSTTGSSFTNIVASAGYVFNPATGNTVTITFSSTVTRYLRLNITANTGWPAGQISEFEVYGPSGGDQQPPSAPTNLAFTQPASGQIRLTWSASTDNVGVTGYDIYANNVLRTSVAGNVGVYTDSQPDSATVTYFVRAKDAAGNQSGNSNSVTRTGTTVDNQPPTAPGSLAFTQPAAGQIRLTWTASSDNIGVTAYDVYANGSVRGTVAGNVLTFTDNQPDTATVNYFVRAKDAAGNTSANSNTVTRAGTGGGSNLAVGKPITASGYTFTFVPANANDNSVTTYWEGAGGTYPNTLTVSLGANAVTSAVVVKLDPSAAWGLRRQTIAVFGREQSASGLTQLVPPQEYTFDPATGNSVTIPVSATVADVRLQFTSNTGAPAGQAAEFQVIGTPAPNPDLTITATAWTPTAPIETDSISVATTVRNAGSAAAPASSVNVYLGTTLAGTATVGALAAGASSTVSVNIGARNAASYVLSSKVDESNAVIELSDGNNSFTNATNLVVNPVQSSDLVVSPVAWTPSNPPGGSVVTFTVAIRNQGTIASAAGAHGITLTVLNDSGAAVRTLTGSFTATIAAGATTAPVNLGTWTATNGRYTVRVVLANDANEVAIKQANNTSDTPLFVGRGANMPYDMYEAEDGTLGGGAGIVGPNRTIGDLGGEASGRRAVTLNSNGSFVQWTTKAATNTLVTRFSMPDSAGGGGQNSTLNIYVDGVFHKAIDLTSRYAWLYGAEAGPGNSPGAGGQRHIYDEANVMLNSTVPAGHTIRLQKDPANTLTYAIDFINLELVAPKPNPDPARYKVPAGFSHQDVQAAIDAARNDTNSLGVYLPSGTYNTSQKLAVGGRAMRIVGAGMWYTRFQTPTGQENTDAGFDVQTTANGSTFEDLAFFGNYTSRQDGPGKVFGELKNVQNLTLNNIWAEHTVCFFWGVIANNVKITNVRIRDTFADGINMTNGSTNNFVSNVEGRGNGDDAFALFSAIDQGGPGANNGNVFENLTATLTWRAAGLAVYGGFNNVFRNLYIADMLTYSGLTISSLDFGFAFIGFGATPPTRFENISLIRSGGHFWGAQTFGAIWCFSASKEFRGIRVSDVDIVDPTYSGIMFQTKYNGAAEFPVTDTIFTNVTISGAQRSGDAFDAKSGFGIWVNELPEPGQGPAVGSATFNHLTFTNNFQNIKNTTSTFTLTINP